MAGSEVPAIDGPAGQGRNQGAADGAVVVLRSDRLRRPRPARSATGVLVTAARARVCLGALAVCHSPRPAVEGARRERGGDRRPKRPPGQPRASSLAAFEPSLHFVDFVHALDDDAAGVGG